MNAYICCSLIRSITPDDIDQALISLDVGKAKAENIFLSSSENNSLSKRKRKQTCLSESDVGELLVAANFSKDITDLIETENKTPAYLNESLVEVTSSTQDSLAVSVVADDNSNNNSNEQSFYKLEEMKTELEECRKELLEKDLKISKMQKDAKVMSRRQLFLANYVQSLEAKLDTCNQTAVPSPPSPPPPPPPSTPSPLVSAYLADQLFFYEVKEGLYSLETKLEEIQSRVNLEKVEAQSELEVKTKRCEELEQQVKVGDDKVKTLQRENHRLDNVIMKLQVKTQQELVPKLVKQEQIIDDLQQEKSKMAREIGELKREKGALQTTVNQAAVEKMELKISKGRDCMKKEFAKKNKRFKKELHNEIKKAKKDFERELHRW